MIVGFTTTCAYHH